MCQNPSAEVEKSHWMMTMNDGLHSNTKSSQNFCYWCGLISHDGKDCDLWLARKETRHTEPTEYGPWLRAMPFNPGKMAFTVVFGLGDGLGGASKPPKTATKTENRPVGTNPVRRDSRELNGVDQPQVPDMENSRMGA